jgi:hypothetical protein
MPMHTAGLRLYYQNDFNKLRLIYFNVSANKICNILMYLNSKLFMVFPQ